MVKILSKYVFFSESAAADLSSDMTDAHVRFLQASSWILAAVSIILAVICAKLYFNMKEKHNSYIALRDSEYN